jgi:hypothetical protein
MRCEFGRTLAVCLVIALAPGCRGSQWESSAIARLRAGATADDVRARLGEPRQQGQGSKPYWTYHWRAPGAAEACQLLVVFDPYSGRVDAYQVLLFRGRRALLVHAWPGTAPDAAHAAQCLRGAPAS